MRKTKEKLLNEIMRHLTNKEKKRRKEKNKIKMKKMTIIETEKFCFAIFFQNNFPTFQGFLSPLFFSCYSEAFQSGNFLTKRRTKKLFFFVCAFICRIVGEVGGRTRWNFHIFSEKLGVIGKTICHSRWPAYVQGLLSHSAAMLSTFKKHK